MRLGPTSPVRYEKTDGPVTAGEVRALFRLESEGRLPADGQLTPIDLKRLLECEHGAPQRPCAKCLGYDNEQDMAEEMQEGTVK